MKYHTFLGVRYRIKQWCPELVLRLKIGPFSGLCHWEHKYLVIPKDGTSLEDLDTVIHEAIHACHPRMSERKVSRTATDISRLLWRLGWRAIGGTVEVHRDTLGQNPGTT